MLLLRVDAEAEGLRHLHSPLGELRLRLEANIVHETPALGVVPPRFDVCLHASLLPQTAQFKSGVAWYGFPYSRGSNNQTQPADYVQQLGVPMLIIHSTADQASRIEDIYRYATALDGAGKYFEMKVYQAEPHGFMITGGALSQSFPAKDAYWQMTTFFSRTLK